MKTFILEDDIDMNTLLRTMLDDEGIEDIWIWAHSVDFIRELTPEVRVVAMDWKTDIDGFELLKIIREKIPDCYIIIVTGMDGIKAELANTPHSFFIQKHPMYLFDLIAEIKRGIAIEKKKEAIIRHLQHTSERIDQRRKTRDQDDTRLD